MKLSAQDTAWGKLVKQRDEYTCRRCFSVFPEGPRRRGLHAHHIFTRSRPSTKFDVINGVALCYGCHRWAHANPREFHTWAEVQLGSEVYTALERRSNRTKASV